MSARPHIDTRALKQMLVFRPCHLLVRCDLPSLRCLNMPDLVPVGLTRKAAHNVAYDTADN